MALGMLELSLGDPAAAERELSPLTEFMRQVGLAEPWGAAPFLADAIEALLRLGRLQEAEVLLDEYEASAVRLDRVPALATGSRCRALLLAESGDAEAAVQAVEQALQQHQRVAMPIEQARTLLVKGQLERRARRWGTARESLEQALAIFETTGLVPGLAGACRARSRPAPAPTLRRADRGRTSRRRARRLRADEPSGGGTALHEPEDGRGEPCPRLPQARHPFACRTRRAPRRRAIVSTSVGKHPITLLARPRSVVRVGRRRMKQPDGPNPLTRLERVPMARTDGRLRCRVGSSRAACYSEEAAPPAASAPRRGALDKRRGNRIETRRQEARFPD